MLRLPRRLSRLVERGPARPVSRSLSLPYGTQSQVPAEVAKFAAPAATGGRADREAPGPLRTREARPRARRARPLTVRTVRSAAPPGCRASRVTRRRARPGRSGHPGPPDAAQPAEH
eukprot:476033-Hanusia_phi.AAC.1